MIGGTIGRIQATERMTVEQLREAMDNRTLPAYIAIPLLEEKLNMQQRMLLSPYGQQLQEREPLQTEIMRKAQRLSELRNQGIESLPTNLTPQPDAGGIASFAQGGPVLGFPGEYQSGRKNLHQPIIGPDGKEYLMDPNRQLYVREPVPGAEFVPVDASQVPAQVRQAWQQRGMISLDDAGQRLGDLRDSAGEVADRVREALTTPQTGPDGADTSYPEQVMEAETSDAVQRGWPVPAEAGPIYDPGQTVMAPQDPGRTMQGYQGPVTEAGPIYDPSQTVMAPQDPGRTMRGPKGPPEEAGPMYSPAQTATDVLRVQGGPPWDLSFLRPGPPGVAGPMYAPGQTAPAPQTPPRTLGWPEREEAGPMYDPGQTVMAPQTPPRTLGWSPRPERGSPLAGAEHGYADAPVPGQAGEVGRSAGIPGALGRTRPASRGLPDAIPEQTLEATSERRETGGSKDELTHEQKLELAARQRKATSDFLGGSLRGAGDILTNLGIAGADVFVGGPQNALANLWDNVSGHPAAYYVGLGGSTMPRAGDGSATPYWNQHKAGRAAQPAPEQAERRVVAPALDDYEVPARPEQQAGIAGAPRRDAPPTADQRGIAGAPGVTDRGGAPGVPRTPQQTGGTTAVGAPSAAPSAGIAAAATGDSLYERYIRELVASRSDPEAVRRQAFSEALMRAGASMMGGTSPHAMVNIGQGLNAGLDAYRDRVDGTKRADREVMKEALGAHHMRDRMGLERDKLSATVDYQNTMLGLKQQQMAASATTAGYNAKEMDKLNTDMRKLIFDMYRDELKAHPDASMEVQQQLWAKAVQRARNMFGASYPGVLYGMDSQYLPALDQEGQPAAPGVTPAPGGRTNFNTFSAGVR